MKPRMNVFITTSRKNLYLAYPAIASLFENNQDSEVFLYIASEDLTEADISAEKELASKCGHHIIICSFDEKECRKQIISSDPEHWPVGAMSCYWMFHEFLPEDVDRILAIEADTVTIGSLREFYEVDLDNHYAACPDPEHKPLTHKKNMEELQGDVLTFVGSVYDVRAIRNDFTLQDILQMDGKISQKYGQSQMELTFGVLFKGKIKYIPAPSYSIEENRQFAERFGYDYMKACETTCRLLHFSSTRDKEKPWNPTNIMPGYLYWWDYARKSPYYKKYFEGQWIIHKNLRKEKEVLKKNISYRNILAVTMALMIILEMVVMGAILKEWFVVPLTAMIAIGALVGVVLIRRMIGIMYSKMMRK
ncbi:MAG: glycosyltransferase family 8 protein [Lachnospiraceae bacterium]